MRRALAVSALLLAGAGGLPAQTVAARLGGELTGAYGARLSVPVVVDMTNSGGQRLGSYTARVQWPTRVLAFCYYCTLDSIMGTFAPPAVNTDSAYYGVLKFTAAAPLGAEGQVVLARLPFTVNLDSAATLGLTFSEMSASGTFANLMPILTAQGGQYCPARGRYGDLDEDGRSNSRDALFLLSHVVGLPVDTTIVPDIGMADVDADGQVTSRDALIILSYAVGLGVPGQRVLVYAASSCATGSPRFVKTLPDTAELVPGQPVLAVVTATDSAGRPVSLADVTWRSVDPNVAFVEGNGVVIGRAQGSTDIIAEAGPGLRAVMRVNVIARRPNWYVNVLALGNPVQLGTAALPYAEPAQAFRHLAEGDTVRVASGTYFITDDGELWRGAVIMGGTPGDTTTRPVLRDNSDYSVLWLRGGQRTEVHNIVFDNPYQAVDVEAVRNLVLKDVKVRWPSGGYGYGVYHCGDMTMDTLRVERSVFEGDSASPVGYAIEIGGCVSPRSVGLLEVRDSRFRWIYSAIDAYDVDSTHVENSRLEDLSSTAIYLGTEYDVVYGAVVFRNSRIVRSYYEGIYSYALRRAVVENSYIESRFDGALYLAGDCCGGPLIDVLLSNDTIVMRGGASYDEWLGVEDGDSVLVRDVLVQGVPDTSVAIQSYVETVGWARLERVRIQNAGYSSYAVAAYNVGRLEVDSLEMTACAITACWGGYGIYSSGSLPGTSVSLTGSKFTNIAYPLQLFQQGAVVDVHQVAIDSAYTAMQFDNVDSVNVTDNVMRKLTYQGIYVVDQLGQRGPLVFARDSISCVAGYGWLGFNINYARLLADSSVVGGCGSYAFAAYMLRPGSMIRRNAFRSASYGLYISGDTTTLQVDSNAISQNGTGLYSNGNRILARWNNINVNTSYGAYVNTYFTGMVHRFENNVFQGNTSWALYSPYDSTDASGNWWGVDGVQPLTSGANSAGGRVNTTSPLSAQPPVPPPAPPAMGPSAPAIAGAPPAPPAATAEPVRPARSLPTTTRASEDAVLQARAADRQARQERQLAEREQRRAARRAAEEQRRPAAGTNSPNP